MKKYPSGYAINGMWFVNGTKNDNKFYLESNKIKKEFYSIIDSLKEQFNDKILVTFQCTWTVSSFPWHGMNIPSYHFQCSFTDKNSAVECAKELLNKLDNLVGGKTSAVIIIAEGDIKDIGDYNMADGMAYVRSGTFLESPEVWMHKWNENNRIFILEGDYLVKPIVEIKRYKDI